MTSALENAVKAGSALMDLEELLRREGIDTTKVMQKAIKAINARSLHVANSSPVRP